MVRPDSEDTVCEPVKSGSTDEPDSFDSPEKRDSLLDPVTQFVWNVVSKTFNELRVLLLLGFCGVMIGAVMGLSLGPLIAITAAGGGIIGLIIGGAWEYRRKRSGEKYDDMFK